jgi:predicted transcriptional regulator
MLVLFFTVRRRDGRASRERIRSMVEAHPGIHVADLAERTGLSWHTTAYHLRVLVRSRLVLLDKGGRERRAFPAGLPPRHRQWLAALQAEEAAEVLRALFDDPRQSVPVLSRRMGYSEKVVRRHVAHLTQAGLVQRLGQLRPVYEPSRAAQPALAEWLRRKQGDAPRMEQGLGGSDLGDSDPGIPPP